MNNFMMNKIKKVFAISILMGIMSPVLPVMAETVVPIEMNQESDIQPRTDIKEWVYKVMNGNLYKRLYNYSTGRWESDWIFVCSGVEEL